MHLKELLVRNVGPIAELDLQLPFRAEGSPKPVVLVGSNGSGKSTVLAQIADGLWELSARVFDDIAPPSSGLGRQYLLTLGGVSTRSGANHCLTLMTFVDDAGNEIHFRAKSGTLDKTELESELRGRFSSVVDWQTEEQDKAVAPVNEKDAENQLRRASLTYFPSWRRERPHWINQDG